MSRRFIFTLIAALGLSGAIHAAAAPSAPTFGIVNFGTCVSDSKLGKQEQSSFEALRKQMTTLLEDTEKQINEINSKFNDPEYLDGLSPEAESELKTKFQTLNEELNRYQNQYYQILNQANQRIYQVMNGQINQASEKVSKEKKLSMVINKEACFSYSPQLDITNLIIAELDKTFEETAKKQAAALQEAAPTEKE